MIMVFQLFRNFNSYEDEDPTGPDDKKCDWFSPSREPGLHFDRLTRQQKQQLKRPIDFFKLFFTLEFVTKICQFTNLYAEANIHQFVSYGSKDGSWSDEHHVTPPEFYKFMGLLIYMGLHSLPNLKLYWSSSWIYFNPVPRVFGSRLRFESILQFLHVVNPMTEDRVSEGRLTKLKYFLDYIKQRCMDMYQPRRKISIDERMVRSKGRSGMRQYIKDKPTKWGFKLWVLADSSNGYTWNFDVYTGRDKDGNDNKVHGLGYRVVMKLMKNLLNQGYHVFFDNFYTGVDLLNKLFSEATLATGTILQSRRNFPPELKETSFEWNRGSERGDMRWTRIDDILCVQWKDKKLVTLMTTAYKHSPNEHQLVNRMIKNKDGKWEKTSIRRPTVVGHYNDGMGGVDLSDQLIGKYNLLKKTDKWWKTLFFHMIDIVVVNSHILYKTWITDNPNIVSEVWPGIGDVDEFVQNIGLRYPQSDFRADLIAQLMELNPSDSKDWLAHVDIREPRKNTKKLPPKKKRPKKMSETVCKIVDIEVRKPSKCVLCWNTSDKPSDKRSNIRTPFFCKGCKRFYCLSAKKQCMLEVHAETPEGDQLRELVMEKSRDR